MKTIQFRELFETEFDIHNIIIMNQYWQTGEEYVIDPNGRPDNGLMFLYDCDFEYIDADGRVVDRAERGSIVYSPVGSKYTCRFIVADNHVSDAPCDYLVNFLLYTESGEPFRLSDDRLLIRPRKPGYFGEKFREVTSYENRSFASRWKIKSLLYELLGELSLELCDREILTRRLAPIFPAIEYIRSTDIAQLDASTLAKRCHLSRSCFSRLFREYTGMPPLEYINRMKISQAKIKLTNGLMSVSEVAESLGYTDVSYFSRYYKKLTGKSPSDDLVKR